MVGLDDLIKGKNFYDIFRVLHPNVKEYTFFRANAAPSRLDRFYLSHDLLHKVSLVEHIASLSDHCGVLFEIVLQNVVNPTVKKKPLIT